MRHHWTCPSCHPPWHSSMKHTTRTERQPTALSQFLKSSIRRLAAYPSSIGSKQKPEPRPTPNPTAALQPCGIVRASIGPRVPRHDTLIGPRVPRHDAAHCLAPLCGTLPSHSRAALCQHGTRLGGGKTAGYTSTNRRNVATRLVLPGRALVLVEWMAARITW